jgi:116 kDa U5 small nuclear ribonucleoprotein component
MYSYQLELLNVPERCRNVSVVGHLHHGKTSLLDLLVQHCHHQAPQRPRTSNKTSYTREKLPRYLDSLLLEQERGISLRAKPICLLLANSQTGSACAVNLMDCPGHADFREDVGVSISLMSEHILLVVDCVEGVQVETEAALRTALNLNKSITLVLTKMERLWLELKLPPVDAHFKLKHTIDRLNTIAGKCQFAPESGNVIFASAVGGFAFSLLSFAQLKYPEVQDSRGLSRRLWGDCFYSQETRKFTAAPQDSAPKRSFVTLVLEPLYKLYTQVLSAADAKSLQEFLSENLSTKPLAAKSLDLNPKPLLRDLICKFFLSQPILGLTDALTSLPVSVDTVDNCGPLLMSICKVYPPTSILSSGNSRGSIDQPRVLCRLWQGEVRSGLQVQIHGTDTEEVLTATLTNIFIPCTRYDIPVSKTSSPWVLLTGIPLDRIIKYGTIRGASNCDIIPPPRLFIPNTASFFRVSIEPLVPSELPKMLQVLRLVGLLYPSLQTYVEESGEHVLRAPGELYLDCILHNLRSLGEVQIRLSDPSASLAETVSEVSTLKCFADTANGKVRITMLAEPMEKGLSELIETRNLNTDNDNKNNKNTDNSSNNNNNNNNIKNNIINTSLPSESILMEKFGWDRLSCRSVLAVSGGNVLLDDTFNESAEGLLDACRASLVQGFQWAVREGPLCEEPIRGVKFRLLSLQIMGEEGTDNRIAVSVLSPAQLVPAARRCCYAAFLTASPRLLEPIQNVNITAPSECVEVIYGLLARRRGHILADTPLAGTPLYTLQALLPLLDSPGFEVDLRSMTAGAAMPHSTFSHWQAIPGDPLDTSIRPALLEPAAAPALARDCLLKMRRRRGIGEDVKLDKYFDPDILDLLMKQ